MKAQIINLEGTPSEIKEFVYSQETKPGRPEMEKLN